MTSTSDTLKATEARKYAAEIASKCSDCFAHVRARKFLGRWVIDINGGSGACYGKTVDSVESAQDIIRIFKNDSL